MDDLFATVGEFVLRPAVPGDEGEIAAMVHELAEYEKAPEECRATPEMVARHLFGPGAVARALMAEADGMVAGFALWFVSFSTWEARPGIYLEDLYVRPAYRRRGIGTAVLRHLAVECVREGYGRLEWSCLEWNELAKRRYRTLGARPMEEWRTWRVDGEGLGRLAEGRSVGGVASSPGKEEATVEPGGRPTVVVYTDGGCRPNPGRGAWAAIVIEGEEERELVGGEPRTTNNRMELMAALMALESLERPSRVILHTDSQYLRNGITSWIRTWKRNGWRSKTGAVKNVDLWQRLDAAIERHEIVWEWVRGHAGDAYNERVDALCTAWIEG